MPRLFSSLVVFAFLFNITFTSAQAQENWSRFRGENGLGQATGFKLPKDWDPSKATWKVTLPQKGQSSPVIWGDNLYITYANPDTAEQTLLCLDAATGAENWKLPLPSKLYPTHLMNDFASTTPAADAKGVYVTRANPDAIHLSAVSHDGKLLWDKDLGPHDSRHGFSSSPMLYKDLVIMPNDQVGKSSIIALHTKDGSEAWIADRPSGQAAYATPVIYTSEKGQDQLICFSSAAGMAAIDPNDKGKLLWELPKLMPQRCVSSPVVYKGMIFGSHGSGSNGKSFVMVKPPKDANEKPEVGYEIRQNAPYVPTCVEHDGLLFLWHDTGKLLCIEPETGNVIYNKRIGGNFHGSPICVDGTLYCIAFDGTLCVVEASKEFKTPKKYKLGDRSRATPAVANGKLYLRTDTEVFCVESAKDDLARND